MVGINVRLDCPINMNTINESWWIQKRLAIVVFCGPGSSNDMKMIPEIGSTYNRHAT